ncbi:MAG: sigma-70 family RNA polymerase sigma factor [Deinococcales bacterium]
MDMNRTIDYESDEHEHEQVHALADGPAPRVAARAASARGGGGRRNRGEDGNDLQRYLSEIGRVQLLDREEEVALARRIDAGKEAETRLELEADTLDERAKRQLARTLEDADSARVALVEANLRLVVSVAKRYRGRGLPLLDLIQEGNAGLMHAVEKYDVSTGYKFSTYAVWWIRQSVVRALANASRTIRLPVHFQETLTKLRTTADRLEQSIGRPPSREEIATAMGESWTVERVDHVLRQARDTLSLERPVGDEDDTFLGDLLADASADAPVDLASETALSDKLSQLLSRLSEREAEVLRLRFGLVDGQQHTLEDIGRLYGITREAVRQAEARALRKLQYLARRDVSLRDFLD